MQHGCQAGWPRNPMAVAAAPPGVIAHRAISPRPRPAIRECSRRKPYKHDVAAVGIARAPLPVMLGKSDELRDRIEARKHELLARYNQLKADTRHEADEARTRLKARLDELELHLKSGWAKVNSDVRSKLNAWLERRD